jgi:hypothetical protein
MEFSLNRKKSAGTVFGSVALVFALWNGGQNFSERREVDENVVTASLLAATIDNARDLVNGAGNVVEWVDGLISGSGEASEALSPRDKLVANSLISFSVEDKV